MKLTKKEKLIKILKEGRVDLFNRYREFTHFEPINLYDADLSGATLSGADLRGATLSGATLRRADLSGATLRDATLRRADLRGATLRGATLYSADLRDANLSGADLYGVRYNHYTSFLALQCPEEGPFIGWKKGKDDTIIKLLIMEDSKRSSATSRKCRASKVKVLEIFDKEGNKINKTASSFDESFIYIVGGIAEVPDFDEDRWNECSRGIHFFLTRDEAEQWGC